MLEYAQNETTTRVTVGKTTGRLKNGEEMSCKIFDTPKNCKTKEHDDCIRCVFGPNGRRTQSYDEWYAEWKSKKPY